VPDTIIVGGGLTGLAAAWELERLHVPYTLIEVKNRLGGSILTERLGGFVLDAGEFILEKFDEWTFLAELGLSDALVSFGKYRAGELVYFRDGTQVLIDALAGRITQPVMQRMAVSSIGRIAGDRFGVCLENGIMLHARAVIVAAPARYADHMLRSLEPEVAIRLLDYQYDPVARVSLGYRRADIGRIEMPSGFKFLEAYSMPKRVPEGHILVRAGVRLDASTAAPADALARVKALFPVDPVVEWVTYWAEADPLTRHLPEHAETMDAIERLLPPGIALVGSDYRAKRLDERVEAGRAAARQIAAYLQG
jgi:protoporphyrinogen oxidase